MRYLILFLLLANLSIASEKTIKIGVLAKRGVEHSLKKWNPTAEYLTKHISGYKFKIVPIAFNHIFEAVKKEQVDFILANPGFYVVLEQKYGAQRITTIVNKHMTGLIQDKFGGVIFTRIENKDRYKTLKSIKNATFAAVDENSLGGWQMAWREFIDNGIKKDIKSVIFKGTHDSVVKAVLNKEVEVGTVRTDTLERMATEGEIDLNKIYIINRKMSDDFPFVLSTRLYPEWPLAKLKHISNKLSKKVAIALMQMPSDSQAALSANIDSWGTPLSYQSVHECFKTLKIAPYYNRIKIWDVIRNYRYWIIFYIFIFFLIIFLLIRQFHLTSFLEKTQNELIQTEKMAALGRLVAGITHEVNTPIGVCVTAASYLKNELKQFNTDYKNKTLTQSSFESSVETFTQTIDILLNNLQRAAYIMKSFKQTSVDQSSDDIREFYLKEYLESIVTNLRPTLKRTSHSIEIICSKELLIKSNPGDFYQIFSNLIINSIKHGFENIEKGHITIEVSQKGEALEIIYKDDGVGVNKENLLKIFDPFFTTKKGKGGSGLGTHIVYNIVTQKLNGTIRAESNEGEGLKFIIYLKGVKIISNRPEN